MSDESRDKPGKEWFLQVVKTWKMCSENFHLLSLFCTL